MKIKIIKLEDKSTFLVNCKLTSRIPQLLTSKRSENKMVDTALVLVQVLAITGIVGAGNHTRYGPVPLYYIELC